MRVLFALRIRRKWIQIGFLPKAFGQRRKAEPGIKLLGRLNNPFWFSPREVLVDVSRFHQARPFLAPAIIDPVRRDLFWHGLMIFLGELVFRPGVQLQIKRT